MLNRQKWDAARFHDALATLVGASVDEHVLDLGCGRGASLGALLAAVGSRGKVVGLDRMGRALDEATRRHASAVETGCLTLVRGEILDPPFPDEVFDAVICQNVVECVDDREALVAQASRVLKPGGRLLVGHHDFDGIILASDDRDLTRRLVHGFADHQQDWQEASEGRMGRMIPGLVAEAGFASVEVETRLFVDLDLGEGSYARDYLGWLIDLAPTLGVSRDIAATWASDLASAATEGRFFFGLPWVGAICRKANS
jgi:SAM-dependent methyltransferase